MNIKSTEYSQAVAKRVQMIMEIIDLDVAGFAEFLNRHTSHIYGILNLTRKLSEVLAKEIGEKLEFDGSKIFNLNTKIPITISRAELLIRFKAEHKDNPEYFISKKSKRSANTFVSEVLLKSDYFDNGYKYLSEITEYCSKVLNREFVGDQLSKALQYAVKTGTLQSAKKPIKLKRKDSYGSRLVDVYYV